MPGEDVAWRSPETADAPNAGTVWFRPAPDGASTDAHALLVYDIPGGELGETVTGRGGSEQQHRAPLGTEHPGRQGRVAVAPPVAGNPASDAAQPIHAGYCAYGRTRTDPARQIPARPSTGRIVASPDEWLVALPGKLPAYLSVERYEASLARPAANRNTAAISALSTMERICWPGWCAADAVADTG